MKKLLALLVLTSIFTACDDSSNGSGSNGGQKTETFTFKIKVLDTNQAIAADCIIESNGKQVYKSALVAGENHIKVEDGLNNYTISVSKAGYKSYSKNFTSTELKKYRTMTLEVILTKETITLTKVSTLNTGSSYSKNLEAINGKLYYITTDVNLTKEYIICFDGQKDYIVGNKSFGITAETLNKRLISYKGKLYYFGNDTGNYFTLFSIDGDKFTPIKSFLNIDIASVINNFIIFQDKLYMTASGKIWTYDGTNCLELMYNGKQVQGTELVLYNNKLFFVQLDSGLDAARYLASYDGKQFQQVNATKAIFTANNATDLTVCNKKLYFWSGERNKEEIYCYDDINKSFNQISNQFSNKTQNAAFFDTNRTIYSHNNRLYFNFTTSTNDIEIWEYDGGKFTELYKLNDPDGVNFSLQFITHQQKLFFNLGFSLYNYDGEKTKQVQNCNLFGTVKMMAVLNNTLYYTLNAELWSYTIK